MKRWIRVLIFIGLCMTACACMYAVFYHQNTSPEQQTAQEGVSTTGDGASTAQEGVSTTGDGASTAQEGVSTARDGASITQVHSSVDKDGDGIDDQTDILQNARDYISTAPKYGSRYYETGYPDDGYGVCTDVVAFALKNAGYDIMNLIQEDIARNPDDYGIEDPDPNIDFRRVDNLKVYFKHTAIALTIDISKVAEWQGGDIVIFQNHIGVISDRRNKNGIPYVIHLNNVGQTSYEQDILEKRKDIVGHYRISE